MNNKLTIVSLILLSFFAQSAFSQIWQNPVKAIETVYNSDILKNTEWESFVFYSVKDKENYCFVDGKTYIFGDEDYTVKVKTRVEEYGNSFSYDSFVFLQKPESGFYVSQTDDKKYHIGNHTLSSDKVCSTLKLNSEERIIVSVSDSVLILAEPKYIFETKDGYYAFKYEKYLSAKYLGDRNFVEGNYVESEPKFFSLRKPLQDVITSDGFKFDVNKWIAKNVKFPNNYKGTLKSYSNTFQLIFNRQGKVADILFEDNLEPELESLIKSKLYKMPSVGTLAPEVEYPVSYWKDYTFKTKDKFTVSIKR